MLAVLREGGVPDELAVLGHHLLFSVVNGFTMDETGEPAEELAGLTMAEGAKMARDYIAALPPDRFPNMVAVADYYAISDADRFSLLIDLYVDGLAARVRAAAG